MDNLSCGVTTEVYLSQQLPGIASDGCQGTGEELQVLNLFYCVFVVADRDFVPFFNSEYFMEHLFAVATVAVFSCVIVATVFILFTFMAACLTAKRATLGAGAD